MAFAQIDPKLGINAAMARLSDAAVEERRGMDVDSSRRDLKTLP